MGSRKAGFGGSVVLTILLTALVGCSPQAATPPAAPTVNVAPPAVPAPVAPAPIARPPSPTTTPLPPYAGQPIIRPDVGSKQPASAPLYTVDDSETGYEVSLLAGSVQNFLFEWATDELLIVGQQLPEGGQIVDLRDKQIVVPGTDQNALQLPQGLSADGQRVAFTRGNQLVVQDRRSGQERSWTVAVLSNEVRRIGTDFLSWSPDGRYLLGSWYPLLWRDTGFLTSKLWVLDYESGDLRSIASATGHRPNTEPIWSPQGDQVVVRQFMGGYKGAPYPYDYLLIDLKGASSEVIVSCPVGGLLYDFRWDTDGKVVPMARLTGPGKTRIVGYDPYLQLYENMTADDGGATYPEVHFLTIDGQVKERIDLRPAFQEQGIAIDEKHFVWNSKLLTPDSRYLLLEGQVAKRDDMAQPTSFMCVIPMDTLVPHLVFPGQRSDHFIDASYRWHDNKVLVASEDGLAMVDLVTLKQTALLNDSGILVARWLDDHVVYATICEVGIVHPDGKRQKILTVADDEEFGAAKLSPSTKYLAIQRWRAGNGSGDVLALEIVAIR